MSTSDPARKFIHLTRRSVLDPRETEDAGLRPIVDAVNIPFSELPNRMHELPPRDQPIRVGGPPALAAEVAEWLVAHGRRGVVFDAQPERSGGREAPGRLWLPSQFLENCLRELPCGAALDLGCGAGRDAVYLASCGWDVTGVDVLPDALQLARDLAGRYAPEASIRWLQIDLEARPPEFRRDYDLVVMIRYLHRPLFAQVRKWLKPGGSLICETFTTLHRERHGKPARDAHVLEPGELPTLAQGMEVRRHQEGWVGGAHTARLWASLKQCE